MYLRHTTVNKDGKTHTYWRLVRSVRRGSKVVQETVAHLGELDAQGRARARRLALRSPDASSTSCSRQGRRPASRSRFGLDQVRLERARRFGDVWLGWRLWCALGLDRFCAAHMAEGREHVPWATMAAILVIARLCEPSSELHIAEDWYRRTALADLLGVAGRAGQRRSALPRARPTAAAQDGARGASEAAAGRAVRARLRLLLYDVTSTYFEGEAAANPLAKRGHSRDHRRDCKQVCIGLVVTRDGIPLGYEVFAGNRTDVTTVEEIVGTMESRYGQANRVWVMDRGMTSAETVAWLQRTGRRYLIGANKSEVKKLAPQLVDARDWRQVRDGVEAKLCAGPGGRETFVLVRSAERRSRRSRPCTTGSASASRPDWCQSRQAARTGTKAGRPQRHRAPDRTPPRAQLARRRTLCDPPRRRHRRRRRLRLDWSIAGRMGRLVAPQRRLLRAAHQHRRLDARGAVADLHPAHRSRSRLPHPQERAVDPADLASASRSACWPTSWSAFSPMSLWKTLEQWQSRAGLGNAPTNHPPGTRRHPQRRHRPADRSRAATRPATALRRPPRQAHRPHSSIASACASRNGSACRTPDVKM